MPGLIQLSNTSPPWDAVRRIYRRVCELRATGRSAEAAGLEESDLSAALATARLSGGPSIDESALLATEDERVADAHLLAELLAPMVASRLDLGSRSPATVESPASRRAPATSRIASSSPQIADMIDDMLAQAGTPAGRPRS